MQEQQIAQWAKPPSEAEEERSLNALAEAVAPLGQKFGASIQIIRQGSHYNRTNIRLDSDVDVAIVHTGYYFSDTQQMGPVAKAIFDRNFSPSTYTFATYKDDVEQVLRAKYAGRVRRGNKCILVAGIQNRNACDVVPAFEHKRYDFNGNVLVNGIEFVTDKPGVSCGSGSAAAWTTAEVATTRMAAASALSSQDRLPVAQNLNIA